MEAIQQPSIHSRDTLKLLAGINVQHVDDTETLSEVMINKIGDPPCNLWGRMEIRQSHSKGPVMKEFMSKITTRKGTSQLRNNNSTLQLCTVVLGVYPNGSHTHLLYLYVKIRRSIVEFIIFWPCIPPLAKAFKCLTHLLLALYTSRQCLSC